MSRFATVAARKPTKSALAILGTALVLAVLPACGSNKTGNVDSEYDEAAAAEDALNDAAMNLAELDIAARLEMNASLDANFSEPPAPPTCASVPSNGALLVDHRGRKLSGHALEIDNGTEGDAIIKVRDADTDGVLASFFVQRGKKAGLRKIPDGSYKIQYMVGDKLGEDCRSFVNGSANEFPGPKTFSTLDMGDRILVSRVSYTLYAVPGGNITPMYLNPAEFEKP